MLRIPVHKIRSGMILARPIPLPHDPSGYLLQRDREIPMEMVPRLEQMGLSEVWVRHSDLDFLEGFIDVDLAEHQRDLYRRVRKNFEAIIRGATAELDLVGFQQSIQELFEFLRASSGSSLLLQKLDAFDNYLMSHSTNICYLALLLGLKLEHYLVEERGDLPPRDAKELHMLGLGCLLHDVGKMRVPAEILNKPASLTAEEMAEMRRHTIYGYEMVKSSIPAAAAEIVLNHHQRWNGRGYPGRVDVQTGEELPPLAGCRIPIFSRITSIVDVYDAATTQRCYSAAKPPVQAIAEMRTMCQGFFDPMVEETFYRTVPVFPIGQIVTLSNGIEAVVIDFNPDAPTRPKVRGLRTPDGEPFDYPALEEIDLSFDTDVEISHVDGQDIRPFTATLRQFHAEQQWAVAEAGA